MNWLLQNSVWIVVVIALLVMMRRGGLGCGMGHAGHGSHDESKGANPGAKDGEVAKERNPQRHEHHGCC